MDGDFSDSFEIVGGPEDGISFPITRTPVTIGANADCAIFLNYDRSILPVHARVTVVSGGYRIRAAAGASVYINGRRSGVVWSRIARSGDIVRVGETHLCLVCAPDGLAGRSIGMPTESNFVWLFHAVAQQLQKVAAILFRLFFRTLSRVNRTLLTLMTIAIIVGYFRPGLVQSVINTARYWARHVWWRVTGS